MRTESIRVENGEEDKIFKKLKLNFLLKKKKKKKSENQIKKNAKKRERKF